MNESDINVQTLSYYTIDELVIQMNNEIQENGLYSYFKGFDKKTLEKVLVFIRSAEDSNRDSVDSDNNFLDYMRLKRKFDGFGADPHE